MHRNLKMRLALAALAATPAFADIVYTTTGSSAGFPVSAKATFTIDNSAHTLGMKLENLTTTVG